MARRLTLTQAQIRRAIDSGEFGNDVVRSAPRVAVVMTQSWCPQWHAVSRWIDELAQEAGLDIFTVVYDEEPFYEEFMHFKETVFGNGLIPYIRYYAEGRLVKETNYTSKDFFLKAFS